MRKKPCFSFLLSPRRLKINTNEKLLRMAFLFERKENFLSPHNIFFKTRFIFQSTSEKNLNKEFFLRDALTI